MTKLELKRFAAFNGFFGLDSDYDANSYILMYDWLSLVMCSNVGDYHSIVLYFDGQSSTLYTRNRFRKLLLKRRFSSSNR